MVAQSITFSGHIKVSVIRAQVNVIHCVVSFLAATVRYSHHCITHQRKRVERLTV